MEKTIKMQINNQPFAMTLVDFTKFIDTNINKSTMLIYPKWRRGQSVFNIIYGLVPESANKFRASKIDPFYIDENIPAFIEAVFNDIVDFQEKNPELENK